MPRINIDDAFWGDRRFDRLAQLVGENVLMTRMRIIQVWRECYERITETLTAEQIEFAAEWHDNDNPFHLLMIKARLCETEGELFRVCGVEERISYLRAAKASGARGGQKSAKARQKRYGTSAPQVLQDGQDRQGSTKGPFTDPSATTKGTRSEPFASVNPLPLPLPLNTKTPTKVGERQALAEVSCADLKIPAVTGKDVARIIGTYISAVQKKYGKAARPHVGGKVQGLIRNLLKDYTVQQLCDLVVAYLQIDDPWFAKKAYDFGTFYETWGRSVSPLPLATKTLRKNPNGTRFGNKSTRRTEMEKTFFQEQIERLKRCFGERHYPPERSVVLFRAFRDVVNEDFADAVTDSIANSRHAPMLEELSKAVDVAKNRRREGEASSGNYSLEAAAVRGTCDREFAKAALQVIRRRQNGDMSDAEHKEARGYLEQVANQLCPTCTRCGGDGYVRFGPERFLMRCVCAKGRSLPLVASGGESKDGTRYAIEIPVVPT